MADQQEIDLVLTDAQNWASRSHRELYDAVHNNNDPGQTGEIGAEWGQFGAELTESARVINERVAATETGWTGESADGARTAIKMLAEWVTQTAATAVEVGKRVEDQSNIMENARASMPEPVEFDWNQATGAFSGGGLQGFASSAADVQAANDTARAAHEQAVAVMTTMENESRSVDGSTPLFTAPFNPVTGRVEAPQPMLMATAAEPTLGDAQQAAGAAGDTTQASALQAQTAATPATPAYTPPSGASGAGGFGGGGGGGGGGGTPQVPAAAPYRPEGTTAAAAAAQVPVANKYTPPAYTPPSGSGYTPPGSGYVPPGYTPPSGGGKQQPPPYKPAPPGTPIPKPQSGLGPKIPPYVPAGTPGTPPVPGAPGAGRFGGGGGGAGGFGGGGFGGGGGGGFGPTGAGGGAGGQLAAGGASGVAGPGARGPMPGFGPAGPGAGGAGSPMGGAPMGGGGAGQGQGDEDKEHRSAGYLRGEDIFDVPGENLPPSVIGGAKPKKGEQ